MTGDSSAFAGTTTVEGTLRIGDGGTTGALGGTIVNDGALVFDRSDDLTHTGAVSGTGTLAKDGAGTLTITNDLTHSGGTAINTGALQIGNGGTTGSISGDIVNNGALIFNRSNAVAYGGNLSGSGTLTKEGAGTLTITGNLTHAGGTTIEDGTLQIGNGGSTGSITGDIVNNGALVFNRSNVYTYGGDMSGSGTLTQSGGGTLTVTGNLTHTGGTTIQNGLVNIGNGGTAGSISGDIVNNGYLQINRSDAYTLTGNVSGSGIFWKAGANTLTLTGHVANLINLSGTLRVGNGGTTGSISNNVANNGTLIFDRSDDLTYGGVIASAGSVIKEGAGTLTFTGNNTYSGATNVNAGVLAVDGSVSGAVYVNNGGALGGTGTVGATTVAAGGTLGAGNRIDALTVTGNLTLDANSVYEVEVDPTGTTSDLVHVTGTAYLAGSVVHIGENGTYKPFSSYTILTADGGLSGTFGPVTSNYAFLDPALEYGLNDVRLTLTRNDIAFASVAQSRNQRAVAGGLESLPLTNPLYMAVAGLTAEEAAQAFNALSGEVHGSTTSALFDVGSAARTLPLRHLRANLSAGMLPGAPIAQADSGASVPPSALPQSAAQPMWVEVLGNWQRLDDDGNAASVEHNTGGIFLGGDHAIGNGWRIGGAFGYADSRIKVDARRSKADVDSYSLAAYAGKGFEQGQGKLNVLLGATHTWHGIDSERDVSVGGLNQHLKADYDAKTLQFFTEIGYALPVGNGYTIEPFVGLAWSELRTDSFSESGGSAALSAKRARNDTVTSTLGLRASVEARWGARKARLHGTLGWRHAEGDVAPRTTFAFDGGQSFTVAGTSIARNAALVELRGDVALSRNATASLSYTGQYGEGNKEHTASVNLRWRF